MISTLNKLAWIVVAAVVLGAISYALYSYTENARRMRKLEEEKQHLEQIVQRVTSHRRAAEVLLTGRERVDGVPGMKLLFVEYARDAQTAASVREFRVAGDEVHLDAKVIRFERSFVFEGDPLRGASIALFTRIFGSKTAPEKGEAVDPAWVIPEVYKGADPSAAEFEARLWNDFWRLLEDADYAKEHGVRIAQGEGLWWRPMEGKLYTISVAADAGLELKSDPVKAIYIEAMKKLAPTTAPSRL